LSEILAFGEKILKNKKVEKKFASKNIENLREVLRFHQKKYYLENSPEISDAEFDQLFQILTSWEKKFPDLQNKNSPTQKPGISTEKSGFSKFRHFKPMLSLANAFSQQDLFDFETRAKNIFKKKSDTKNKLEYFLELKFDGISLSLHFENGNFVRGITRGNGEIGENISQNLTKVKNLPHQISSEKFFGKNKHLEIRGEILMTKKDFQQVNKNQIEKGLPEFKNPRNATSGTVRNLDPIVAASRPLHFFAFEIFVDGQKLPAESQQKSTEILQKMGFSVSPLAKKLENLSQVFSEIEKVEKNRQKFAFETDGVVLKINDFWTQKILGSTGHHPRWAIAFKFPAEVAESKIEKIFWQVGRTGVLTPVAEISPVKISGVKISRATLHNFDEICKKDFRVGDFVILERAGDVIPHLLRPILQKRIGYEKKITPPKTCPSCQKKVTQKEGEVAFRCQNLNCPAQITEKIIFFAGKNGMDIPSCGEKTIRLFLDRKLITDAGDLFFLKFSQISKIPRFAEKSAQNLITGILSAKNAPLWKLLSALAIPLVGKQTAKVLVEKFGDLQKISAAEISELENVFEIGPGVAKSIFDFFRQQENKILLQKLLKAGINFENKKISKYISEKLISLFSKKKVVVSGKIGELSREKVIEILEDSGATVSKSISQKTDFLIIGEKASNNKIATAKKLGTEIFSGEEFWKIWQETNSENLIKNQWQKSLF